MDRITRPHIATARPIGVGSVVNGAQPLAVSFRFQIGTRAVVLLGQVIDGTATALAAFAALARANPWH